MRAGCRCVKGQARGAFAEAILTSGYRTTAEDVTGPGTGEDCANSQYDPAFCRTRSFVDVDLTASYSVNDHFTLYGNVLNLFDASAPFNPSNYAGLNYNPTWTQSGVIGRSFRAGARIKF